jgi:hypothetical protein
MSVALLPPRPLRLRRDFVRRGVLAALPWLALSLALLGYGLSRGTQEALRLREEARIWEEGHDAGQSIARGQQLTQRSLLRGYVLEVVYNDAEGIIYHRDLSFEALAAVDTDQPAKVRYDTADPGRFALSWGIEVMGARWAALGLYSAFFGAAALLLFLLGLGALRPVLDARRAALRSDEVACEVLEIRPPKREGGEILYRYRLLGARSPLEGEVSCPRAEGEPLFMNGRKHILALVAHRARRPRPIILRDDLFPFEVSAEELRALRERLASL